MNANTSHMHAQGPKPRTLTLSRILVYASLVFAALVILMPLYVMVITSLKSMAEIRQGGLLSLPLTLNFEAWSRAWSSACTGLSCNGISVGFWNSAAILIPSVVLSHKQKQYHHRNNAVSRK